MKLGNPANYFVQVWPSWWDEPAETAALYTDVFALAINAALAGRVDEFTVGPGEPPNTVFYVTAAEFAAYRDDLASLAETAGGSLPEVRHDDVADLAVVRFLDTHVLSRIDEDVVARR